MDKKIKILLALLTTVAAGMSACTMTDDIIGSAIQGAHNPATLAALAALSTVAVLLLLLVAAQAINLRFTPKT